MGLIDRRVPLGNYPTITRMRRSELGESVSQQSRGANGTSDPWLIVLIIIGVLVVTTLVALLIVYHARSRIWKQEVRQANPISRFDTRRRRKISAADRQRADDLERAMIIRKSLASRSSISFSARSSRVSAISDYPLIELSREKEPILPRDDWKEWEAQMQNQREDAGLNRPASLEHPALMCHISLPKPSRSPSPARGTIQPRRATPPPQLFVAQSRDT
ncbi:hypothetical protein F5Y15DRAFT_262767 [Xylariaceae sp. FL0016]|nr:hypothetical protein F5Y15DRAFT_262767 [Xylariaceae sp. FL0016]